VKRTAQRIILNIKTHACIGVLLFVPCIVVGQSETSRLTNTDIVNMVRAQISADIIVAKIKVSRCNFNTEPTILAELKQNGVPDAVILAMIQAPYGPPVDPKPTPEQSAPRANPPGVQPFDPEERIKNFRNHKRFALRYDKFKDRSSIDVGPFVVGGDLRYALTNKQLYMTARFLYPGQILMSLYLPLRYGFRHLGQSGSFSKADISMRLLMEKDLT
jgi:hypothetical protein